MGSLGVLDEGLQLHYPTVRRDESVVDDYHGHIISDPYRWLENPDSLETKEFVEKQSKLTNYVLKRCETREKLRENLTRLFDFPKYGAPFRAGYKYFYFHNTGLQPQSVLYIQNSVDGKAEVLVDPNTFSEDGTSALRGCAVSHHAHYLAFGTTCNGSDWITIKVMHILDKTILPHTLSWVKFSSISWTHDTKGFFYSRYPAPQDGEKLDAGTETDVSLNHQLYYHFLGSDQSQDILCWTDLHNPKHRLSASVTDDGKYVLLYTFENCDPANKIYYYNISEGLESYKHKKETLPFVKLIDTFDASYNYVANDDTIFTFLTNKHAPRNKLVRVDLQTPSSWTDVLQQHEVDVLESAVPIKGNRIITNYLSSVKNVVQIRDLETGDLLHSLPLDIGTVSFISCRREDSTAFIAFTSFLVPGIIYTCSVDDDDVADVKILREIVVPGFDRTAFDVNQVFVASKDGTKIPSFIVSKKGISLDGSHPSLLYGYGGFNSSITPYFAASRILIAKHLGVVFCVANIRGGGEYGEEWHKGGTLSKKQNSFDDFISVAEYLVSAGYTQPSKLCIEGGSNGGLLIGACINQRPDLFGCALAHVGVMDMLRFHKFTIGHAWTSDFGCSDKEEEFHWLIKYSPLHNIKRPWEKRAVKYNVTQYPSTMLLTADHDDRVVPLHSLKFLATMQHVLCTSVDTSFQTNPIIGRIERKAGHGAGMPTQKIIDEGADRYGFMAKMVGAPWIE